MGMAIIFGRMLSQHPVILQPLDAGGSWPYALFAEASSCCWTNATPGIKRTYPDGLEWKQLSTSNC